MIDRHHRLPLAQQAKVLGNHPGTLCYVSRPVLAAHLASMRRIDELDPRVDWQFTIAVAESNLVRLPKLLVAAA